MLQHASLKSQYPPTQREELERYNKRTPVWSTEFPNVGFIYVTDFLDVHLAMTQTYCYNVHHKFHAYLHTQLVT